jgi:hypothetical protein
VNTVPDLNKATALERDESSSRSIFLFEHDLRANASRLSRRKTGTHPSGRGPGACFSGSCSIVERSGVMRHPDLSALSRFNAKARSA